jgi:tetratricopeptide (TPR) repeat protein
VLPSCAMVAEKAANAAPERRWVLLDERVRISESVLYQIQRHFYDRLGPTAWSSGRVPSYMTCNTYIAGSYAAVIMAHLRESVRTGAIDRGHPVYIVELGAGSGTFAFQFIRKLGALLAASSVRELDVRYVMTDYTRSNTEAWQKHPQLAALAAAGKLDFAKLDAENDAVIELAGGGELSFETCANPLVVFANYVFDSFRNDLFKIRSNQLAEVRVSTRVRGATAPSLDEDGLLERLHVQYSTADVEVADLYPAFPELAAVLDEYRRTLADTTIAIPLGAFVALRSLLAISRDRLLLLTSDKGLTEREEMYHPFARSIVLHDGCFSMMVNYDAIGRYVAGKGGHYAATSLQHLTLKTVMCIVGGEREDHIDTLSAFKERVENVGPGELFDFLLAPRRYPRDIHGILSLLRISGHDPRLLYEMSGAIREMAGHLTPEQKLELRLAIQETWASYLVGGPHNLAFEIARTMMALGHFREAVRYCELSNQHFGERASTLYNMSVSYYHAEEPERALELARKALELDPSYTLAGEWEARLLRERERTLETASA